MTLVQQEKFIEKNEHDVSKFNMTIYSKLLRKGWLLAFIPGFLMIFMGFLIAGIWPEFKDLINEPGFQELLKSPVYTALLGSGELDMSTFQGFWAMELLTILDFVMLFLTIFIPVRIISNEVDKNTLDIILSYPIPRWQFITQKFLVYLTQMGIFIIFIIISAVLSTELIGETFNYKDLLMTSLAMFFMFFTLGAISLLAGALFLDSGRALPVAGIFIIGMWIFNRIGGLTESLELVRSLSVYHYLIPRVVLATGKFPLDEAFILLSVGIIAFVGAIMVFQKRELAY